MADKKNTTSIQDRLVDDKEDDKKIKGSDTIFDMLHEKAQTNAPKAESKSEKVTPPKAEKLKTLPDLWEDVKGVGSKIMEKIGAKKEETPIKTSGFGSDVFGSKSPVTEETQPEKDPELQSIFDEMDSGTTNAETEQQDIETIIDTAVESKEPAKTTTGTGTDTGTKIDPVAVSTDLINSISNNIKTLEVPAYDKKYLSEELDKIRAFQKEAMKDIYKQEAMEQLVHGLAQMAAGIYGLKHGVNLSGLKFNETDWKARMQTTMAQFEEQLAAAKEADKAQREEARDAYALKRQRLIDQLTAAKSQEEQEMGRRKYNLDLQQFEENKRRTKESERLETEKFSESKRVNAIEEALRNATLEENKRSNLAEEDIARGKIVAGQETAAARQDLQERKHQENVRKNLSKEDFDRTVFADKSARGWTTIENTKERDRMRNLLKTQELDERKRSNIANEDIKRARLKLMVDTATNKLTIDSQRTLNAAAKEARLMSARELRDDKLAWDRLLKNPKTSDDQIIQGYKRHVAPYTGESNLTVAQLRDKYSNGWIFTDLDRDRMVDRSAAMKLDTLTKNAIYSTAPSSKSGYERYLELKEQASKGK